MESVLLNSGTESRMLLSPRMARSMMLTELAGSMMSRDILFLRYLIRGLGPRASTLTPTRDSPSRLSSACDFEGTPCVIIHTEYLGDGGQLSSMGPELAISSVQIPRRHYLQWRANVHG